MLCTPINTQFETFSVFLQTLPETCMLENFSSELYYYELFWYFSLVKSRRFEIPISLFNGKAKVVHEDALRNEQFCDEQAKTSF